MIETFLKSAKPYIADQETALPLHNQVDLHCSIQAFESIIRLCKNDIAHANVATLETMVQELCQANKELILQFLKTGQLDQILDPFLARILATSNHDISGLNVNETNLLAMISLYERGQKILKLLKNQHTIALKKRWYSWFGSVVPSLASDIEQTQLHVDLLRCRIETDSEVMSENLITHCSDMYHFLYAILRYARLTNDVMLEIALNAVIDRILFILQPSLQKHTLKNQYLLYYHVAYELQELHRKIITDI